MAAGRTTKTVGDGNSGTITGGFLSSDGTNTGTLTPAPTLYSSGGTELIGTQADAVSLPTAFSTEGKAQLGALTETAPATDTASSGLNGRLQRIAQRLTSLIAFIGTFGAITAGRSVIYDVNGNPVAFLPNATANGATSSRVVSTASNNLTNLKASAGNIYEIDVFNVAAYTVFLKIYNKASAPVVASDTPIWTIPIEAGTGYSKSFAFGKSCSAGIAYAIVKLQADTDNTNVVAGDLTGSIDWA